MKGENIRRAFDSVKQDFSDVNKKIGSISKDISSAKDNVSGFNRNVEEVKEQLRNVEREVRESLDILERKLDRRENFNSEIKRIHKAESELQSLKGKVVLANEFEKELGSLILDIRKIDTELKRKGMLDNEVKKINLLESEVQALKGKATATEELQRSGREERYALEKKIKEFSAELQYLETQLKKRENLEPEIKRIRKLEYEIQTIQAKTKTEETEKKIQQLKTQIEENKNTTAKELKELNTELQYINNQNKKRENLEPEIKRIRKLEYEIQTIQAKTREDVERRIEGIKKQLSSFDNAQDVRREIEALKKASSSERKEAEQDIGAIVKEITNIQQKLKKEPDLNKIKEELHASIKQTDSTGLKEEIGMIQNELKALSELTTEPGKIREEIQVMRHDLESLQRAEKSDWSLAEKQIGSLKSEGIEELKKAVAKVHQENKKLQVEFKSKIAFNKAIYKEMKSINKKLYEDNRFEKERLEVERKIALYRDEKVEELKSMLVYVLLGVGAFAAIGYFYFKGQGLILPEISSKLIYAIILIVVLLVIIFIPKDIFHKIRGNWVSMVDFLAGKK